MTKEISAKTVIKRTNIVGSQIDGDMVFFNHSTGKYYGTGLIGSEIWTFLESPKSIDEICEHLLGVFEIDRATCEMQVLNFVPDLIESGIAQTDD